MKVIQVLLYKCALAIALVVTHEILCVQGRQLRPTNDQDFSKLTGTPTTTAAEKKQDFRVTPQHYNIPSISTADHHSAPGLGHEDAFRPAPMTPGKGPGIGHSYTLQPVHTTSGKGPGNGYAYAFRPAPTTPGKGHGHAYAFRPAPRTPGKGSGNGQYSYSNENEKVDAKGANYDGRYSTTGAKEDFRPTSPGHSPGVGHRTGKNAQLNA
ncbi:hypothetical protein FNV43_RR17208 [Rhamnella rubrinervis]|uniref:Uncharacterized protein n=1 Tax=Rhamnella rubrinervis TaxID=2594499 RepID=A0A8K0E2S0_9ROSA|nr:hypothetical protein FNV43_RR17208 [Rhamnella rubrinervis]